MSAIIIGSGSNINKNIFLDADVKSEFVICADGGLEKVENLGLMPDVILGDFDSVNSFVLQKYKELNIKIVQFPAEKDYTDMELAIEYAIEQGYKDLVLIGATGTRLDHTLANILMLEKYFYMGIKIKVIDNNNSVELVQNKMIISKNMNSFVSIIPVTKSIEGVTLKGFRYPLNKVKIQRGSTLCVSNEIIEENATVELEKGIALLFISKD